MQEALLGMSGNISNRDIDIFIYVPSGGGLRQKIIVIISVIIRSFSHFLKSGLQITNFELDKQLTKIEICILIQHQLAINVSKCRD